MTIAHDRVEALLVGRIQTARKLKERELVEPLLRFRPATMIDGQWREVLATALANLQRREVVSADLALMADDPLAKLIGPHGAKRWAQLADKILPGLGLGVAADDAATHRRLAGRDAWAAAIAARALGLWTTGPVPSLASVCDAFAWQQLGLTGKPKRLPAEVRALFFQKELGSGRAAPEVQVRLLASREVNAARPDLRSLLAALVRTWVEGGVVGPRTRRDSPDFATQVRDVTREVKDGVFGERNVFIASAWNELRIHPPWQALTLDEFKRRLLSAHRAGQLDLARADLPGFLDSSLVAASEIRTENASFHFIVREAS